MANLSVKAGLISEAFNLNIERKWDIELCTGLAEDVILNGIDAIKQN